MKNSKRAKAKHRPEKFDRSTLSADDLALLEAFHLRRADFERQIEENNIIYYKLTCAACGFPSLLSQQDFELCVICEWEDDGSDREDLYPSTVNNYLTLIEARIRISHLLRDFEKHQPIDYILNKVIQSIKVFKEKQRKGEAQRHEDFNAHLQNILND